MSLSTGKAVSLTGKRWYDREPACPQLIQQLREISNPEVLEFCAQILLRCGEALRKDLYKQGKKQLQPNSIGAGALAGLYQFGVEKRRWYDANPTLQKGIGIFYTLPPEGLSVLGFKLGDAFGLLQIYAQVCQQVQQAPQAAEMLRIVNTSMNMGHEEAEAILISLAGKELFDSLKPTDS